MKVFCTGRLPIIAGVIGLFFGLSLVPLHDVFAKPQILQDTSSDCTKPKERISTFESSGEWVKLAAATQKLRSCKAPNTQEYAWTYTKEAYAWMKAEEYEKAESTADQMIEDDGAVDSLMISYALQYSGVAAFRLGESDFSIGDYQVAVHHAKSRTPESKTDLFQDFADVLLASGKFEKARDQLHRAIQVAKVNNPSCGVPFEARKSGAHDRY